LEERSLKLKGEELARIAVSSGMGAKQLQTIYKLTKTRSLAFVEAYVQRQIGRGIGGLAGFRKILESLQEYGDNKGAFERVLMYAVMLYDYVEKEPVMELKEVAEPIVKRVVERYGARYRGLSMNLSGKDLQIDVDTWRSFHGNPKSLAREIEQELRNRDVFANMNLRIWIK